MGSLHANFGIGFRLQHLLRRGVLLGVFAAQCSFALPSFDNFKALAKPSDGVLYDRHGAALGSKRLDLTHRRLGWVGLEDISPALIEALLVAEDRRFYAHQGVDWLGVVTSIWNNLNQNKTRGASSISMQVAALLDPALERGTQGRSTAQKWLQINAALDLEKQWSKQQILEAYVNSIYFRSELQGLAAASWGLFSTAPSGLDKAQSALLAALIRAPNAKAGIVAQRACAILKTTRPAQPSCDATGLQATLTNASLRPQALTNIAPHVAQQLLSEQTPQVHSTLDGVLQRHAQQILSAQLANLIAQGAQDGAAVVLDNTTGEVLAYVGSSGDAYSQASLVDAARAQRQAGSTLKPFLYGLAIEQKRLTAASVLDDGPLAIATEAGMYTPQNYDQSFIGDVSVRRALASSLNIPAVRTYQLLAADALHTWMQKAGFTTLEPNPAHYGPSLALGSADVALIELTNAYRALANGGLHSPWRLTASDVPAANKPLQRRILSAEAAWVIGHILSDNTARAHTFGFDSPLATPFWTAVKTGTSKDMRDNWCLGYSQRFTVGVWVGNAAGNPMHNVSGVGGAAPAWAEIMQVLHANASSRAPAAPKTLTAVRIAFDKDIEPGRTEWFVAGTAPALAAGQDVARIQLARKSERPRITQPSQGALLAWDPDIPAAQQGVVLKHSGVAGASHWAVNGKRLDGDVLLWARDGVKGKTKLELLDLNGEVLDNVVFELRGVRAVMR